VDVLRREFADRKLSAPKTLRPWPEAASAIWAMRLRAGSIPQCRPSGSGDDACFLIFRTVLAFDHARQQIQIRTLAEVEPGQRSRRAAAELRCRLRPQSRSCAQAERRRGAAAEGHGRCSGAGEADFESNFERAEFERAVAEGKELIFAGECFQIVLSQRFRRRTTANAVALYRALRATNPSPYMFLLNFGASAGGRW
jgi:anthranilate synthase component 1